MAFRDRLDAGSALAREVASMPGLGSDADIVVLALPRGGVPVAAPVATLLAAPLDVLVVRKLGLPRRPELAMGAIAGVAGEVLLVENEDVLSRARPTAAEFEEVRQRETGELRRREAEYRGGRAVPPIRDRTVILVDDGLATGSTMRAAIAAVQRMMPARIVVAVPVGASRTCAELAPLVSALICPLQPKPFLAVGQGYQDFSPTEDDEVRRLLAEHDADG
jgi:putative phosphoribosyl transferase